jgi:hypothetical protein
MRQMIIEKLQRDRLERTRRRSDLIQDLDAISILVHHALQAPNLTLDPPEPLLHLILPRAVPNHANTS